MSCTWLNVDYHRWSFQLIPQIIKSLQLNYLHLQEITCNEWILHNYRSCYALKWYLSSFVLRAIALRAERGLYRVGLKWYTEWHAHFELCWGPPGLSIVCVRICWNCWHGRWLSEISELTRAMCYAKLPAGMPTVEVTLQRKRFTNIGSHQMVENGSNMNTNVLGQYLISFDVRASLYFYLQAYAYQSCANQYNITLP